MVVGAKNIPEGVWKRVAGVHGIRYSGDCHEHQQARVSALHYGGNLLQHTTGKGEKLCLK